jgi:hypothetical protein
MTIREVRKRLVKGMDALIKDGKEQRETAVSEKQIIATNGLSYAA